MSDIQKAAKSFYEGLEGKVVEKVIEDPDNESVCIAFTDYSCLIIETSTGKAMIVGRVDAEWQWLDTAISLMSNN